MMMATGAFFFAVLFSHSQETAVEMKRYQPIIILINLVLALGIYHYSVMEKEKTLSSGKLVLLELAPVDPRSLMKGII